MHSRASRWTRRAIRPTAKRSRNRRNRLNCRNMSFFSVAPDVSSSSPSRYLFDTNAQSDGISLQVSDSLTKSGIRARTFYDALNRLEDDLTSTFIQLATKRKCQRDSSQVTSSSNTDLVSKFSLRNKLRASRGRLEAHDANRWLPENSRRRVAGRLNSSRNLRDRERQGS